jgi:hypothetical protein
MERERERDRERERQRENEMLTFHEERLGLCLALNGPEVAVCFQSSGDTEPAFSLTLSLSSPLLHYALSISLAFAEPKALLSILYP